MRLQHKECSIFEGTVKKGLILNIQNDIKIVMGFSYSKLKLKKNKKMEVLILGKNRFDERYSIEPFVAFTTTKNEVYLFDDEALLHTRDSIMVKRKDEIEMREKGPEYSVLQYYEGIFIPLSPSYISGNEMDWSKISSAISGITMNFFNFFVHHNKDIYCYEKKLLHQKKMESAKMLSGEKIKKEAASKIKTVLSIDLPGAKARGTKLVKSSIDEYEFYRRSANILHDISNRTHDPRLQDLEQFCNRNIEQLKPIVYVDSQKKIVANQVLLELLCLSGKAILLIIENYY